MMFARATFDQHRSNTFHMLNMGQGLGTVGSSRANAAVRCTLRKHAKRCRVAGASAGDPTTKDSGPGDSFRVLRVNYLRTDGKAAGFGLHVWGSCVEETDWEHALSSTGYPPANICPFYPL